MTEQLTTNTEALRLFFTDDVYLVTGEETGISLAVPDVAPQPVPEVKLQAEEEIKGVDVPVEEPETVLSFQYLGKNTKNILILVHDAGNQVSTEEGRELLRKIVKAIDLTANDFAVLNYASYPGVSFAQLNDFFKPKLLLSFGVAPEVLGIATQEQNVLVLQQELQLIFSSGLHVLAEDMNGKKALWGSLKQLTR